MKKPKAAATCITPVVRETTAPMAGISMRFCDIHEKYRTSTKTKRSGFDADAT